MKFKKPEAKCCTQEGITPCKYVVWGQTGLGSALGTVPWGSELGSSTQGWISRTTPRRWGRAAQHLSPDLTQQPALCPQHKADADGWGELPRLKQRLGQWGSSSQGRAAWGAPHIHHYMWGWARRQAGPHMAGTQGWAGVGWKQRGSGRVQGGLWQHEAARQRDKLPGSLGRIRPWGVQEESPEQPGLVSQMAWLWVEPSEHDLLCDAAFLTNNVRHRCMKNIFPTVFYPVLCL